jgi:hypothetical protein
MTAAAMPQASLRPPGFYVWMSGACILLVFVGFAPTYWGPLLGNRLVVAPIVHLHAAVFSGWMLFVFVQSLLGARAKLRWHRGLGLFAISYVTLMACIGLIAMSANLRDGVAGGWTDRSRPFAIVTLSALCLFLGFFTAAIFQVRRPEWHKRLMLVASILLAEAAVARASTFVIGQFVALPTTSGGPPPVSVTLQGIPIMSALLLVGALYDWRKRGRPHAAYIVGLGVFLVVAVLRVPIAYTTIWTNFMIALENFLGH